MIEILSLLLYYSASLCFGVTYNSLHLVYIMLFGILFFSTGIIFLKLHTVSVQKQKVCSFYITKGMKIFLLSSGTALVVAWLPDIITSIVRGTSLELIEVYTTEITYVLLRILLRICMVIGIMLPVQTFFQLAAGKV